MEYSHYRVLSDSNIKIYRVHNGSVTISADEDEISLSVVFILFVDPSPITIGEGFFHVEKLLSVISCFVGKVFC